MEDLAFYLLRSALFVVDPIAALGVLLIGLAIHRYAPMVLAAIGWGLVWKVILAHALEHQASAWHMASIPEGMIGAAIVASLIWALRRGAQQIWGRPTA